MQTAQDFGRILPQTDGWIACPKCRYWRFKRVEPDEEAERIGVYCRRCKQTVYLKITKGQSFESRSQ